MRKERPPQPSRQPVIGSGSTRLICWANTAGLVVSFLPFSVFPA